MRPGLVAIARRVPEPAHAVDVLGRERHMRGELVGEAADFAPAHRIGLAGERERSHAGAPDAAGREMAVEDGVDLVGAADGLVDALGIERHHPLGARRRDRRSARTSSGARSVAAATNLERRAPNAAPRRAPPRSPRHGASIQSRSSAPASARCASRPPNSSTSAPGASGRCRSAVSARRGAARIDGDDLGAALLARRHQALIEDRMAPGHVAADQDDQIGFLQILVAARHHIFAEGAHMAGDRGRHAQPRIGVDIGRADEAFHQLVGDVIILGQELAGDIEGDRVRPVRGADAEELAGDEVERLVPVAPPGRAIVGVVRRSGSASVSFERRALRAQPPEIGGMVGVAPRHAVHHRDAAADAAIGTGGADRAHAAHPTAGRQADMHLAVDQRAPAAMARCPRRAPAPRRCPDRSPSCAADR